MQPLYFPNQFTSPSWHRPERDRRSQELTPRSKESQRIVPNIQENALSGCRFHAPSQPAASTPGRPRIPAPSKRKSIDIKGDGKRNAVIYKGIKRRLERGQCSGRKMPKGTKNEYKQKGSTCPRICRIAGTVGNGDGPITSSLASWFSSRDAYGPVRASKSAARRGKRAVRSRCGRSSHSSRGGELCGNPATDISHAPHSRPRSTSLS